MTAGGSAAETAAAAERVAERKRQEAESAARIAAAWAAGSAGEQRVAEILGELEKAGYTHLHDRCVPNSSANIDHIAVGPPGVFVIDAKAWTGSVTVTDKVLRQDGHARRDELESSRRVALLLANSLDGLLEVRVDVRPAICFVGDARLGGEHFIDRVKLIDGEDLAAWMQRFDARLAPAEVLRVHQHLMSEFPAKTGEAVVAEFEAPEEVVVYLFPWKRARHRRLYVRSNDGADIGYLDLVSGRVSSPSEEWEQILVQLLPHHVLGDGRDVAHDLDLSNEAQGTLRRFVARVLRRPAQPPERPIIACYRWQKHGKDRLYLKRLLPGGRRVDLGFVDLDTGFLRTSEPGATNVLGYCGRRFQQLELT